MTTHTTGELPVEEGNEDYDKNTAILELLLYTLSQIKGLLEEMIDESYSFNQE